MKECLANQAVNEIGGQTPGRADRWLSIFAWLALFYYILSGLPLLQKPLSNDEVEFGMAAVELAHTGKPLYYMGETWGDQAPEASRWWVFHTSDKPWYQYGFWHPPSLVHAMALSYKVFGFTDWAARLPGFLCGLASFWLARRSARLLAGPSHGQRAQSVVTILYGLNPFLLQQSVMVDADNTMVNFCAIWYLHEYTRLTAAGAGLIRKHLVLAGILACACWAKEFTGVYIIAACGCYLLLRRDWKELAFALLGFVAGCGLFVFTWCLYCRLGHYDPWYWYHFTVQDKLAKGMGLFRTHLREGGIQRALWTVWFTFYNVMVWVGPFLFVMLGWGLIDSLRQGWKSKRPAALDLFCIFGVTIIGASIIYRPSMQLLKYTYPMFVPIIVFVGLWLVRRLGCFSERDLAACLLSLAVVGLVQGLIFGDLVHGLYNYPLLDSASLGLWYAGAILGVLIAVRLLADRAPWRRVAALSLLPLCGGVELGTGSSQIGKEYVTTLSWNNYGDSGLRETIEFAKANIKPSEMLICRKEFGFYLRLNDPAFSQRWYCPPMIMEAASSQELVRNLNAPRLNWIILDRYLLRQDAVPFLERYFTIVKVFGDPHNPSFYVLKRRA